MEKLFAEMRGNWHHDNNDEDNNTCEQAQSHLHILPPHALADTVGTALELARGLCQCVRLVLQTVKMLAALGHGVEIVLHYADRRVELSLDVGNSGIAALGLAASANVGVIGLTRGHCGCMDIGWWHY